MTSKKYWIVAAHPNGKPKGKDAVEHFLKNGVWMTNKHLDDPKSRASRVHHVGRLLNEIDGKNDKKEDRLIMVKPIWDKGTRGFRKVLVKAIGAVKERIGCKVEDCIWEEDGDGFWYKAKVNWKRVNGEEGEVVKLGGFRSTIWRLDRNRENHKPLIDFVEKWLKENP